MRTAALNPPYTYNEYKPEHPREERANLTSEGKHERRFTTCFATLAKSAGVRLDCGAHAGTGHGANAIVFSVLNALVLRPLNVPHPENLFMVERNYGADTTVSQSYPDYRDLRDLNRSFDSLVTYDIMGGVGLDTGSGNPAVVWPYMVSGNYFDALSIQPYLGRFIHASEERGKNSVPEIVLSYSLWHSRFNGDPAAVGRTVQINKHTFTIVALRRRTSAGLSCSSRLIFWLPSLTSHKSLMAPHSKSAATTMTGSSATSGPV